MIVFSRLRTFTRDYPIIRGITAYAVLWPLSSVIQQGMHDRSEAIDWSRALRFGLFGSCFVAPTLYFWVRFSTRIFPGKDFRTSLVKAVVEQITYGPCALTSFYFGMSALEMKSYDKCVDEVKKKFMPTYKVGLIVWPAVQTINNYFVPEKNRVVIVSLVSFLWTCFLSHMKSVDLKADVTTEEKSM